MKLKIFIKTIGNFFSGDRRIVEAIKDKDIKTLNQELSKKDKIQQARWGTRGVFTYFFNTYPVEWGNAEYLKAFELLISKIDFNEFYCAEINLNDHSEDLMVKILHTDISPRSKKELLDLIIEKGFNAKSANPEDLHNMGCTILEELVLEHRVQVLSFIMSDKWESGQFEAATSPHTNGFRENLLSWCIEKNDLDSAKIMLKLGADYNKVDVFKTNEKLLKKDNPMDLNKLEAVQIDKFDLLNDCAKHIVILQKADREKLELNRLLEKMGNHEKTNESSAGIRLEKKSKVMKV